MRPQKPFLMVFNQYKDKKYKRCTHRMPRLISLYVTMIRVMCSMTDSPAKVNFPVNLSHVNGMQMKPLH